MERAVDREAWQLMPGERIIWQGTPDVRAYTFASSWLVVPFSILWGGFAIFWEIGVILSRAPWFFTLWGIPFVLMGLYLIGGRFVLARLEALRTSYAITDLRILIRSGVLRNRTTVLDLTNLPPVELSSARFGTTTITFGQSSPYARWLGTSWFGYSEAPAFRCIRDGQQVFSRLTSARADAMRSAFGPTPAPTRPQT